MGRIADDAAIPLFRYSSPGIMVSPINRHLIFLFDRWRQFQTADFGIGSDVSVFLTHRTALWRHDPFDEFYDDQTCSL